MKTVDREKLWEEYQKKKTPELREKLIIEYSPLVKLVAGRLSMYLGYNVEYDDLVSYGIFGLIDAIDKFDLGKEVKFETYASLRIRGTILDQIRKMDWIPRTVRQKQKKIPGKYLYRKPGKKILCSHLECRRISGGKTRQKKQTAINYLEKKWQYLF